jgi:glycosyltransferase involved in cell wall biosynthesis
VSAAARTVRLRVRRLARRLARSALLRYARAKPRHEGAHGAEPRVYIMLNTAFGMGGTIRAGLNLAGYLAPRHDVRIVSVGRTRDKPFFEFPPGVGVSWIEDRRRSAIPPRHLRSLHKLLSGRPSLFMHRSDAAAVDFTIWTDLLFARWLHRRSGVLLTTRPGLNLLAADFRPPGLITVGLEQMNFRSHRPALRRAMEGRYDRLDVLAVLTETDMSSYADRLDGRLRLERIPNTVRDDMGPASADLGAKVVITAGRFTRQKGYDLLIAAWLQVAERHPEWRLRIFGNGQDRGALEAQVGELGLGEAVTLEKPAADLAGEMEQASIYVLSSRHEGLPLVLLEAMSKGMAVVSFDCPTGPADAIDDHVNGLLVPPQDVDALAAGMIELIEDVELRRRCAAAAVETAREYTMDRVGPQWEALLHDLWEERRGAARRAS